MDFCYYRSLLQLRASVDCNDGPILCTLPEVAFSLFDYTFISLAATYLDRIPSEEPWFVITGNTRSFVLLPETDAVFARLIEPLARVTACSQPKIDSNNRKNY